MKRLCKNCDSFVRNDDNSVCKFLNIERSETDNPPPNSSCWKKRPKLSGEALSLVRSAAGRKGGGGRPKGTGRGRSPTKQASLRFMDHAVIMSYAKMKNKTFAYSVHLLAKSLLKQYPQLKPDCWID